MFAIIAPDTTRSRAYLQALCQAGLLPAMVFQMGEAETRLPGQLTYKTSEDGEDASEPVSWQGFHFSKNETVSQTVEKYQLDHEFLKGDDLNSDTNIAKIERQPEQTIVFSGYGGVILKPQMLRLNKTFLHVHGGILPDYRGSTTNYYSLIKEGKIGAAAIVMNQEIDQGDILYQSSFELNADREEVDHVYDPMARAIVLREVITQLTQRGTLPNPIKQRGDEGELYFVIHPVLKHIAITLGS